MAIKSNEKEDGQKLNDSLYAIW